MNLPTLSARNALRNKTRTLLTVLGVMVAVFAFGFLRTVIKAWHIGVEAASNERLVTRHKVSIVMAMPVAYTDKIAKVPGVTKVARGQWFGGIYKDPKNFFAKFAADAETLLDLYPEFVVDAEQRKAWLADKQGCLIGAKLAKQYGFKIGDTIPIQGDIFPGEWKFVVRAIYEPRDKSTDATQMFFHWSYLNDSLPDRRQGQVNFFWIGISDPNRSAEIAKAIDANFKDTPAETLTESEKAFQMSFLSMASAILTALDVISAFVLVIIALILGNTIAMSVRDRSSEVAILKALGFRGGHMALLITGEAVVIALAGGVLGILVSTPLINSFGKFIEENMGSWFPVFELEKSTMLAMLGLSVAIGAAAAMVPALRVARLGVVAAFRRVD